MNKNLKNFIEENRRAFDDDMPAPELWSRIKKPVGFKKKAIHSVRKNIYKWAVAAILIIAVGAFLILRPDGKKPEQSIARENKSQKDDIGKLAPEYAALAKQIFHSIELKQAELKSFAADEPGLYEQFTADMAALDSSYNVLKHRATQSPGREEIIKAMLQNLQLQAELLSKQLQVINEVKNNKTDTNEKDNYRSL